MGRRGLLGEVRACVRACDRRAQALGLFGNSCAHSGCRDAAGQGSTLGLFVLHVTDGSDCHSAARIKGKKKKGLNTRLIDWWQKFMKAASVSFFCNVILRFVVDLPIVQPVVQKKEF